MVNAGLADILQRNCNETKKRTWSTCFTNSQSLYKFFISIYFQNFYQPRASSKDTFSETIHTCIQGTMRFFTKNIAYWIENILSSSDTCLLLIIWSESLSRSSTGQRYPSKRRRWLKPPPIWLGVIALLSTFFIVFRAVWSTSSNDTAMNNNRISITATCLLSYRIIISTWNYFNKSETLRYFSWREYIVRKNHERSYLNYSAVNTRCPHSFPVVDRSVLLFHIV